MNLAFFLLLFPAAKAFVPTSYGRPVTQLASATDVDDRLQEIASKLRLEVTDFEGASYGYDSKDPAYALQVLKVTIPTEGGLGLGLTEMARGEDGRGLVLINEVFGNAATAYPYLHVGDVIVGVITEHWREKTTGVDYELMVQAINKAKDRSTDGKVTLEINRLVKRSPVTVEVDDGSGKMKTIEALAGENLRSLLMRKDIRLYDSKTKRFDMPYATGDCAGEGLCGTCLVNVLQGKEMLNHPSHMERLLLEGRPPSWRAACRAVVGSENQPGTLRISLHPQSRFEDELDPGVKKLHP